MYIGQRIRRVEDARFLRGKGRYVDDVRVPEPAHAVVVRSRHAHARIRSISTDRAAAMPGVLAVLTAADWKSAGLGDCPLWVRIPSSDGVEHVHLARPVLCDEQVCYVGDPVALVVAETRDQATDATEAVEIDYQPLPSVTETARALAPDGPLVHERLGSNMCFVTETGSRAAAEAAFDGAAHVVELALVNNRVTANSLETRTAVGVYDDYDDRYTLWASHQSPHMLRLSLAESSLGHPEHKIRVIAPDVGGGFGMKLPDYSEEPLVLWAARVIGRPVRWLPSRSESVISDAGGRDHYTECRMAFDREGRILGLWVDTIACVGAYMTHRGASIPAFVYSAGLGSIYRTPAVYARVRGVYTNTPPVHAYRGAGRPEAYHVVERLIETGARDLAIDPCELRARNLIPAEAFPYTAATGVIYDSGDPPGLLEKLTTLSRYDALRAEQKRLREQGLLMGIGIAGVVESVGLPSRSMANLYRRTSGWDQAAVRVHPAGKVTVLAGSHSHGQGHATTFAQIAADRLGIEFSDVEVVQGDTDRVPYGHGTFASRSLVTTGMAVVAAAERILEKCRKIAAHLLECAEEDLAHGDGAFTIRGTDRRISFAEIARAAHQGDRYPDGLSLGLEEVAVVDPVAPVTSSGMHLAVVLTDPETGCVTLRDYFIVDDSGHLVNPMVVEGQIHGGLVQGLGQALMENLVYDRDTGQPLAGSFMDYAMPRAADLPSFRLDHQHTPSQHNALGVKAAAESGTMGALGAMANAVVDALWHLGVRHIDMPLTPARVWQAIREAGSP